MAANFWTSSHCTHLLVQEDVDKVNPVDKEKGVTLEDFKLIKMHMSNYILKLAQQVKVRQRVVATAVTYMRRVYTRMSMTEYDPRLVAPACLYLASKAEESTVQARLLVFYIKKLYADDKYRYEIKDILEMEMKILEALKYYLVVFHPYRSLSGFLQDAGLNDLSMTQLTWGLVNDTYKMDLMLEQQGEATIEDPQILMNKIKKLKEKIQKERLETVQKKLQINEKNLQCELSKVMTTVSRYDSSITGKDNVETHSLKIEHPLEMYDCFPKGLGNKYLHVVHDVSFKKTFRLQRAEKIPHYTTWLHLIRNERMTKADAFSARRNIYYDQHAGETMICSDTDEEVQENKEVKRDFSYGEDKLLWMAIEEYSLTDEVLSIVQSYIGGTTEEIEERYKYLKEKSMLSKDSRENASNSGLCLDKSLSEALSTFDHFFCRRCLIFDCPLHGCSQPLIYYREKQPIWQPEEGEREECGDHCYLKIKDVNISSEGSTSGSNSKEITYKIELMRLSNSMEGQDDKMHNITEWKPLEKDICLKGIEMFGKNSCLIYRNLLAGFKTCMEIDRYMREEMPNGSTDENGTFVAHYNDHEGPSSSKRGRRKGKNKKSGYLSKSRGIRSSGKRMIAGDSEPYKPHYTPCECQGMCTKKECPCLLQGSCCEKYCGCDKQCRYRFRGCLCVKSQCRTRQCPCFAAKRECDPDVCKDCWASCGDDTFKGPIPRGDGQCENMNLLLGKNKQKILLARSDVAGWGAFLKNSVNKNEYLGEYTGELISHKEAEKRGKLYERENFSFLFDVDDKYCIDAYRKGDKLKFANHSSEPNCYPQGMFVGGDYRVAIFAKERIEAGEELFYDYNYTENQRAPSWFLEANKNASKKKESTNSHGKGKKFE